MYAPRQSLFYLYVGTCLYAFARTRWRYETHDSEAHNLYPGAEYTGVRKVYRLPKPTRKPNTLHEKQITLV